MHRTGHGPIGTGFADVFQRGDQCWLNRLETERETLRRRTRHPAAILLLVGGAASLPILFAGDGLRNHLIGAFVVPAFAAAALALPRRGRAGATAAVDVSGRLSGEHSAAERSPIGPIRGARPQRKGHGGDVRKRHASSRAPENPRASGQRTGNLKHPSNFSQARTMIPCA